MTEIAVKAAVLVHRLAIRPEVFSTIEGGLPGETVCGIRVWCHDDRKCSMPPRLWRLMTITEDLVTCMACVAAGL